MNDGIVVHVEIGPGSGLMAADMPDGGVVCARVDSTWLDVLCVAASLERYIVRSQKIAKALAADLDRSSEH